MTNAPRRAKEWAMSDIPLAPVFIVGCPRSGTTLLRNLLSSHPHLAFRGESHFIPSFLGRHGDPPDERAARKLATEILNLRWVRDWGLELVPGDFAAERSFSAIVARLYAEVVRVEGKRRWGDKTPQYVLEIPLLFRLFPDARVLHIIRDGRDVALSWLAVNFGPENVYTSALEWRKYVEAGRGAAREFPGGRHGTALRKSAGPSGGDDARGLRLHRRAIHSRSAQPEHPSLPHARATHRAAASLVPPPTRHWSPRTAISGGPECPRETGDL